jgi:NAD(P)-dependent dehydrogenase (short-subunit alcohol dehydrogenase family)
MVAFTRTADVDLAGYVALVTGGGRGFGRVIARALAAAGARVAVVARSPNQLADTVSLIKATGGLAVALPADVTDHEAIEQVVHQAEEHLGPIDLLVNNAAALSVVGPIWEVDPQRWWHDVDVNLRGPFLCARAVLPGMLARRRGRIINVVSIAAQAQMPYISNYCCSKAALVKFTEDLAGQTADHGVSVFALDPGGMRSALTDYLSYSEEGQKWWPEFRAQAEEGYEQPDNPGPMAVFLASGRADPLSGRYITVHDDIAALVQRAGDIVSRDLRTLRIPE